MTKHTSTPELSESTEPAISYSGCYWLFFFVYQLIKNKLK